MGQTEPRTLADYFTLLEAPRRFAQDLSALETNFFTQSRALHPDRFSADLGSLQALALEKMGNLNQAYRTLTKPDLLRDYVLEGLLGPVGSSQGLADPELAEEWFDLQDVLHESPSEGARKLGEFWKKLEEFQSLGSAAIRQVEAQIDQAGGIPQFGAPSTSGADGAPRELFVDLRRKVQRRQTLRSLMQNVATRAQTLGVSLNSAAAAVGGQRGTGGSADPKSSAGSGETAG